MLEQQLAAGGLGVTFEELKQRGFINIPIKYRKYEQGGFKTPTGKVELYSTRFEGFGYSPLPYYVEAPETRISAPEVAKDFPLVLTTGGRVQFYFNSEHRQVAKQLPAIRSAKSIQRPPPNTASPTETGCGSKPDAAGCGKKQS